MVTKELSEYAKEEGLYWFHITSLKLINPENATDDFERVSLEEFLNVSDFISIHLPLTESTKNLISFKEFDLMKSSAVLINVSRGGVVDEKALINALKENKIKAVAVDVYEKEPPENFDLIDDEKVFPAPHLGASTVEGQERAGIDVISILKEFFNV